MDVIIEFFTDELVEHYKVIAKKSGPDDERPYIETTCYTAGNEQIQVRKTEI